MREIEVGLITQKVREMVQTLNFRDAMYYAMTGDLIPKIRRMLELGAILSSH